MNPEFMEPQTNESGLIQPDITELELIQPMVIEVEFTQPESVHSEADPTLVDELSFIVLPASHSSAIPPPVSRREFFPTLLTHHAVIDTCPLIALPIPSVSSPSTTPLPAPQLRVLVMLLSLLMDVLVICLLTYAMLSYLQPVRVVYGIHDCYYGVMMYLRVPCVMPQSFVFHESYVDPESLGLFEKLIRNIKFTLDLQGICAWVTEVSIFRCIIQGGRPFIRWMDMVGKKFKMDNY
jgi:hypothetical protein